MKYQFLQERKLNLIVTQRYIFLLSYFSLFLWGVLIFNNQISYASLLKDGVYSDVSDSECCSDNEFDL